MKLEECVGGILNNIVMEGRVALSVGSQSIRNGFIETR
jgi:hypothetical protein